MSHLNLGSLTPNPIPSPYHPTPQVVWLKKESHCMFSDQSFFPNQEGLNPKALSLVG